MIKGVSLVILYVVIKNCITVLTTNKERTNKEQITFFKKIYWALISNKFLEKIFYQANCRFSYFDRLFLENSSFH